MWWINEQNQTYSNNDPSDEREFRRLARVYQVEVIKELFVGAFEQRAAYRIQRKTLQTANPEEVGGAQMNLQQEKREQFFSAFRAWVDGRFNGKYRKFSNISQWPLFFVSRFLGKLKVASIRMWLTILDDLR